MAPNQVKPTVIAIRCHSPCQFPVCVAESNTASAVINAPSEMRAVANVQCSQGLPPGSTANRRAMTTIAAVMTSQVGRRLPSWIAPVSVGFAVMPGGYPGLGSTTNTPAMTSPIPKRPTRIGPASEARPETRERRSPNANASVIAPAATNAAMTVQPRSPLASSLPKCDHGW